MHSEFILIVTVSKLINLISRKIKVFHNYFLFLLYFFFQLATVCESMHCYFVVSNLQNGLLSLDCLSHLY